ncbi:MAG: ATP-dependent dethiobiotin synthetase BioD [Williamsia herbipolensis]|uniref:ATP-dependent dethiobiotin synthetase BioD n=1 Tax=Williamsia serinedens TaxID=391736 RepID=A0ABT1H5G5_9NOCA|nr:dethiobiotin synthase [Williamsia serinedens]MBE7161284.1 ATP-dependent dethiobiotin synthetase BioD [Williamsia herbipolensis]MCP2162484.1 dethiobiotin synthetase [Williamsia serinedens]
MTGLVVTGTSTDVGKTVATAALTVAAEAAGMTVGVCKPAQTGVVGDEPGDIAEVVRLTGAHSVAEGIRYPDPLAPETAAARAGMPPLTLSDALDVVARVSDNDLVLVEGAGGVLVRLGPDLTALDVAEALSAPLVVVAAAGLGTLNHTELTVAAARARGVAVAGVVLGSWPDDPDLATRCNRDDLPRLTGVPIVGVVPAGAGRLPREAFRDRAPSWFSAEWVAALRRG